MALHNSNHKQLISKLVKRCNSRSVLFWLTSFQDNRSYVQLEKLTFLTHTLTTWVSVLTITHLHLHLEMVILLYLRKSLHTSRWQIKLDVYPSPLTYNHLASTAHFPKALLSTISSSLLTKVMDLHDLSK